MTHKIVSPALEGKFRALQEDLTRAHSQQTQALSLLRKAHLDERNTLAEMITMAKRNSWFQSSVERLLETYGDSRLLADFERIKASRIDTSTGAE